MAETGFSHRFTAYKIVRHFSDCHIRKYPGVIRLKVVFFRISNISVPCPHAQLRVRTVKKLWTFFGLSGRIALSHCHVGFFRWSKYIHPRPWRGRQGKWLNSCHTQSIGRLHITTQMSEQFICFLLSQHDGQKCFITCVVYLKFSNVTIKWRL